MLSDEQIDNLMRLVGGTAAEQPYALDELVGTVEQIASDAARAAERALVERAESAEAAFRAVSNATAAEAHELGWREAIDALGWVLANGSSDWGASKVVTDAMVYVANHPTDPYNRAALRPEAATTKAES